LRGSELKQCDHRFEARRQAADYERVFRARRWPRDSGVADIGRVAISLARGAWPALSHFGFRFVTREVWNP